MTRAKELLNITLGKMLFSDREELFRDIWECYRKRIFYYITSVMHCNTEDGEDLLQEIMMKVYNNLQHYKAGRSFNAWIYSIARNHCLDFRRKLQCRPCCEEIQEYPGNDPGPYERVCSNELHQAIMKCLKDLDSNDREMIYLRYFEGLRFAAIGSVTGMNVNSVKTRMRVLEARLRQDLKEWL